MNPHTSDIDDNKDDDDNNNDNNSKNGSVIRILDEWNHPPVCERGCCNGGIKVCKEDLHVNGKPLECGTLSDGTVDCLKCKLDQILCSLEKRCFHCRNMQSCGNHIAGHRRPWKEFNECCEKSLNGSFILREENTSSKSHKILSPASLVDCQTENAYKMDSRNECNIRKHSNCLSVCAKEISEETDITETFRCPCLKGSMPHVSYEVSPFQDESKEVNKNPCSKETPLNACCERIPNISAPSRDECQNAKENEHGQQTDISEKERNSSRGEQPKTTEGFGIYCGSDKIIGKQLSLVYKIMELLQPKSAPDSAINEESDRFLISEYFFDLAHSHSLPSPDHFLVYLMSAAFFLYQF